MTSRAGTRFLTKSLFKKACECPRKLAYALSPKFQQASGGQFLQSLAEDGRKIEAYSRLLFPDGVQVGGSNKDGNALDQLVEETRSLLASDEAVTIFEGAICDGPFLIRADILHKAADSRQLRLIEVKAKSWDSRKDRDQVLLGKRGGVKADYLPYIRDVAFQKMIVQRAFPDFDVKASLVLSDKAKINHVPNLNGLFKMVQSPTKISVNGDESVATTNDIQLDESSRKLILSAGEFLVTEVDVDDVVDMVLEGELAFPGSKGETFQQVATDWANAVAASNNKSENLLDLFTPPPIGSHCGSCEYRIDANKHEESGFNTCWEQATDLTIKELSQGTPVVDIWHGGNLVKKLISKNKYIMTGLAPEDLGLTIDGNNLRSIKKEKKNARGMSRTVKQWYQVNGVPSWSKTPDIVLDEVYLHEEMEKWRFPLHFVDFETSAPALPYSVGRSPFDYVAFQFSHHVLHQDGTVEHASEFLNATPGQCPNAAFLDALADSVGGCDGTVFRWGAHENTVLSSLLEQQSPFPNSTILEALLIDGSRSMFDLMQLVTKGYYVAGSDASSSIKKLLLPTMRVSERLRQIYGKPDYSSTNFTDMQWWQKDIEAEGQPPRDPYGLLNAEEVTSGTVAQGGDAIIAYNTLQQSDLDPSVRAEIETSLLRYCELDTLAMVMIVQALQSFLEDSS